jgi:plasmid stabilization system protein ParE
MAYETIYKKRFAHKLTNVITYLEHEWGNAVAQDFLLKVKAKVSILSQQPYVGKPSEKAEGVRGILISKHNKLYYRISGKKVIILNLYDTRINPKKNFYK